MDLGNPYLIASGLFIGLVGMVMLMYGRKQENLRAVGAGLALCIYPYFVGSLLAVWGVFLLILAALWAANRYLG